MTLFKTLGFVLGAQMRDLWQAKNTLSIIGRILVLAIALLYAVGFGFMLLFADRFRVSKETMLAAINSAIAALLFVKNYFPAYQATSQPIVGFLPMSRPQRALLGVLVDCCSVFPLAVLLFYGVMVAVAFSVLSTAQILASVGFFLTALLLDRSLRLALEYRVQMRFLYLAVVLVLSVILFGHHFFGWTKYVPFAAIILPLLLLSGAVQMALAIMAASPQIERVSSASTRSIGDGSAPQSLFSLIFKAFFGSKHVYTLFGVAVLLKLGLLIFFWKNTNRIEDDNVDRIFLSYILWIYIAPIAWFTYVLNNSFGMNWHLWQTYHHHRGRAALGLYFLYTALPLVFDGIVSLAVLLVIHQIHVHIIVKWLACAGVLVGWGLFVAVRMPIKVEKLTSSVWFSFRSVSSSWGMIGVIALCVIISVVSAWSMWLPLALLIPSGFCIIYVVRNYSTLKYRLYEIIHQT